MPREPDPDIDRRDLLVASLAGDGLGWIGPEIAWIDITSRQSCAVCGAARGEEPAGDEMSAAMAEDVARSLAEAGCRQVVPGWRGDPLAHSSLGQLVQIMQTHQLEVTLQSCFHGAREEELREVLRLPLRQLRVRVHGPPATAELGGLLAASLRRPRPPLRVDLWTFTGADDLSDALRWATAAGAEELRLGVDAGAPRDQERGEVRDWLDEIAGDLIHVDSAGEFPTHLGGLDALAHTGEGLYPGRLLQGGFTWRQDSGAMNCPGGRRCTSLWRDPQWATDVFARLDDLGCPSCLLRDDCLANLTTMLLEINTTRIVLTSAFARRHLPGPFSAASRRVPAPASLVCYHAAWIDARGCLCLGDEVVQAPRPGEEHGLGWWNAEPLRQARLELGGRALGHSPGTLGRHNPCDRLDLVDHDLRARLAEAPPRGAPPDAATLRWIVRSVRSEELRQVAQDRQVNSRERWLLRSARYDRRLQQLDRRVQKIQRERRRARSMLRRLRARLPGRELSRGRGRRAPELALVMAPLWGCNKPPLSIAVLVEYLRSRGVRVVARDLNIECHHAAVGAGLDHIWSTVGDRRPTMKQQVSVIEEHFQPLLERAAEDLLRSDIPLIGFFVNERNRHVVRHLAGLIRREEPLRRIIYGGPDAHTIFDRGRHFPLPHGLYVVGEGERTLLELTRRQGLQEPLDGVRGTVPGHALAAADGPARALAGFRPGALVEELDRLPFPRYDDFPLEDYATGELPFLFSRGCIARCSFCNDHVRAHRFRCRSGEHAVAELSFHHREHHVSEVNFNDLICNGDLPRLERLCELILAERLSLRWWSYAMIRAGMGDRLIRLMVDAGCRKLHFGVEAGSDSVLRRMRKQHNVALAEQVLRRVKGHGISTAINLMVGFPGETERCFEETCAFLRDNAPWIDEVLNLSVMGLKQDAELVDDLCTYGVQRDRDGSWTDDAGNTEQTRDRRVSTLLELLEELGIRVRQVNRPEQAAERDTGMSFLH